MKIYLLRHEKTGRAETGIAPGAYHNLPLTLEGQQRANALAPYFDEQKFDAIYSSPLDRAMDTAQRATRRRYEIRTEERLAERSTEDVFSEVPCTVIDDIVAQYEHEDKILVVSHGKTIKSIMFGTGLYQKLADVPPIDPGCIHILDYDGNQWTVETINYDPR